MAPLAGRGTRCLPATQGERRDKDGAREFGRPRPTNCSPPRWLSCWLGRARGAADCRLVVLPPGVDAVLRCRRAWPRRCSWRPPRIRLEALETAQRSWSRAACTRSSSAVDEALVRAARAPSWRSGPGPWTILIRSRRSAELGVEARDHQRRPAGSHGLSGGPSSLRHPRASCRRRPAGAAPRTHLGGISGAMSRQSPRWPRRPRPATPATPRRPCTPAHAGHAGSAPVPTPGWPRAAWS